MVTIAPLNYSTDLKMDYFFISRTKRAQKSITGAPMLYLTIEDQSNQVLNSTDQSEQVLYLSLDLTGIYIHIYFKKAMHR